MEKHIKPLIDNNVDSQFMAVIAAVIVIIITIVLFAIWHKRRSIGNSILLTGLSDAGKTLIYAHLLCSKFVKTHTSVKENIGDIIINNRSLKIVDIPGHERLRYKFFDQFKLSAKGLVYVIDSVTFQKDIRDVAEYLYNLLSDSIIQKKPVLILCNKQDQTMAKGSVVIKTLLEKEMNLLRMTKTSQLEATDASATNIFLGKQEKDFDFSHLDINIEFAECSAYNKDSETSADMEQLNNWLKKII
ncbi:signal recognition particle receptor subunit beta [Apis mellifera caucasica]|uniref:Signal recognition particle receptor subunit beta n=1 Tax=Apis mellifera TaxID=7460 RepID=A0A7M7R4R9_APIME|nr:signal recognition particle receptor subunit beta [Apis mellifera]KAG6800343.1 signal recognition particle receptor subunit beta [Apis mellifera caucasica]KAG9429056.1 signal recognition particle receptor subunit beta [Apis mellifera carnica]|eukprot:XP_393949.2 signal recognition particle receptor subunit beta [Apis mellifera]